MAKRFIDADELELEYYDLSIHGTIAVKSVLPIFADLLEKQPTADVVEVVNLSEQIIRKKAEIIDYWKNNVKQYRAMQGYCDIEHDTDNFLRGYNEAVEDMLAILDSARMDGDDGETV